MICACVHAVGALCARLCLFLFGFVLEWCTKAELPVSIVTPGFVGKEVGRITQLHDAVETRQLGPMSLQYKDSQALQVPLCQYLVVMRAHVQHSHLHLTLIVHFRSNESRRS